MKTVIGAFDTFAEARNAVDALERAGFNERDVSIVANNDNNAIDGTRSLTDAPTEHRSHSIGSETATGAMVGGLAGLVLGLAPLVIPGLGAIAAAGWLTMTLTGAAIGAGVGLIGALVGVGVPEEEAHYYNENVRRGGTLVLVRADDERADDVARVLSSAGAIDIDERAAQYRSEGYVPGAVTPTATASAYSNTATTAAPTVPPPVMPPVPNTANTMKARTGETAIPVIEEQIQVGKQQMQRGGVRVYTHVHETPVNETVNLREEHVNVERRPVDRPISAADRDNLREGTIEVRETAEVPIIEKQARVVEEVIINKNVTEHVQNVGGTVRRTDVEVEELPGTTATTGTVGATNFAGNVDTRGPLEKAEDFVTGDTVDDKTGQTVTTDNRNIGQKAADTVTRR